jgi:hypothetical protein
MTWFPSVFELLLNESEKAIELMIPMTKVPTVGAIDEDELGKCPR